MSSRNPNEKWGVEFPDLQMWSQNNYTCPTRLYRPWRSVHLTPRDTPYNLRDLNMARNHLLSTMLSSDYARRILTRIGVPHTISPDVYSHVFDQKPYPHPTDQTGKVRNYQSVMDRVQQLQNDSNNREPLPSEAYFQHRGNQNPPKDFTTFDFAQSDSDNNFTSFESKRKGLNTHKHFNDEENDAINDSPEKRPKVEEEEEEGVKAEKNLEEGEIASDDEVPHIKSITGDLDPMAKLRHFQDVENQVLSGNQDESRDRSRDDDVYEVVEIPDEPEVIEVTSGNEDAGNEDESKPKNKRKKKWNNKWRNRWRNKKKKRQGESQQGQQGS